MLIYKTHILFLIIIAFVNIQISISQVKFPAYRIEAGGFASIGNNTPFWLISNKYGK